MKPEGLLRPHQAKLTIFYRFTDAILIALTLVIASMIYGLNIDLQYKLAMFMAIATFSIIADTQNLYLSFRGASFTQLAWPVLKSWAITIFILLGLAYLIKATGNYSRVTLGIWVLLTPTVLVAWRVLVHCLLSRLRSKGHNSRKVAIIGAEKNGFTLSQTINNTSALGLNMIGLYDDRNPKNRPSNEEFPHCRRSSKNSDKPHKNDYSLEGNIDDLISLAQKGEVDLVYIALSLKAQDRTLEIIERLADAPVAVYLVPDLFVYDLLHSRFVNLGSIPTISIYESPYFGVSSWLKKLEDMVLSSIILTLIAIPMLFIAAGVKLSSPGPVIFRLNRYGIDGSKIKICKFRSMTTTDDGDTIIQATKNDARVTKFGAFLRKTSLDELPQFINVFKGEMSVVGPRPHAVAHNEEYRAVISGYMLRHKVKPGITGWAQVNGWRGETDTLEKMEKRIEHDIHYIQSWSILLDLQIVFRTIFSGFIGKSAY